MVAMWLMIFVIFLIAEIATSLSLVSIWFCIGSLAGMLAAKLGCTYFIQLLAFVVVSAVFLIATRPFVKKISRERESTNADRIIGMKGIVIEDINNVMAVGAIKVDGKEWTARTKNSDTIIEKGKEVVIVAIEGVKAIVE